MGAWNITASPELISAMVKMSANSSNNVSAANNIGLNSDYAKILQQQIAQMSGGVSSVADSQSTAAKTIETIKHFKPDGSIVITTYEDGKITDRTRIKPHLVPVPDFDAPLTPEGKLDIKYVPHMSLMELLMI